VRASTQTRRLSYDGDTDSFLLASGPSSSPAVARSGQRGRMEFDEYLRDQAAKYRQLAEKAEDSFIIKELLDLAAICEEVANNIEDRLTGG
jgi:hypothetical protein